MISLELSSIQHNTLQSAIINAQVEEFLRGGGQISTTPPMKSAPLPYGRLKPIDQSTKLVRAHQKKAPGRTARAHPQELIDRIATLAETMPCKAVAQEVGLSYDQVKCVGMRNGIVFRRPCRSQSDPFLPEPTDEEADKKLVERILAFKELGATRRKCHASIGIGVERFNRILDTYGIEYPKAKNGRTWAVPS